MIEEITIGANRNIAPAAQPDQGYIAYKITLSMQGTVKHSVWLNESSANLQPKKNEPDK